MLGSIAFCCHQMLPELLIAVARSYSELKSTAATMGGFCHSLDSFLPVFGRLGLVVG
ncbi:hypothetical protein [Pontibacter diazotrophicus]|uniref:hypothetical protein n=1 Tax=Pontibacter diazotrophicus TaxID=1400979 RepID=UPI0015F1A8F7|nr:hypothetical protein [Pontibacter diazotrophicus]